MVEISVGGLAWCLKQTQKIFFFEKNKGQECVCYQKNFGCLSIFTTRATAFFSKTIVYLSEWKHPKLRWLCVSSGKYSVQISTNKDTQIAKGHFPT